MVAVRVADPPIDSASVALDPALLDGPADCEHCAGLCCRLTVVLDEYDHVREELVERLPTGQRAMRQDPNGWCVALGADRRCTIYTTRPGACGRFAMAGPYCLAIREDARRAQQIPLLLHA